MRQHKPNMAACDLCVTGNLLDAGSSDFQNSMKAAKVESGAGLRKWVLGRSKVGHGPKLERGVPFAKERNLPSAQRLCATGGVRSEWSDLAILRHSTEIRFFVFSLAIPLKSGMSFCRA